MALQGEAQGLVVVDHLLRRIGARQGLGRRLVAFVQARGGKQGRGRRARQALGRPQPLAARQLQGAQRIGGGQGVERGGWQVGPGAQVVDGGERPLGAGGRQAQGPFLAEAVDAPQAQAHGAAPVAGEGARGR